MKKHIISFGLAFSGIWYVFKTQPNFRVHILAAAMAILTGLYLKINYLEWVVLSLTIVLVFSAEMINTSIESMTNLITTEYNKHAKIAKDVSAGMVLLTAIGSLIVAAVIFLPKII